MTKDELVVMLNDALERSGLSIDEFSMWLSVSRGTATNWLKGKLPQCNLDSTRFTRMPEALYRLRLLQDLLEANGKPLVSHAFSYAKRRIKLREALDDAIRRDRISKIDTSSDGVI